MSAYVRKTAAHAIPKLAETDETCYEELIEIISRLLGDKAPLVAGSAVLAYRRVCPGKPFRVFLTNFWPKSIAQNPFLTQK